MNRFFIRSSAIILAFTALAKVISAAGSVKILALPDPLLLWSNRSILITLGIIEVSLSAYLITGKYQLRKLAALGFLASCFLGYRLGLTVMGYTAPCHCLGTITEALPITHELGNWLSKATLAYLFLGSHALMVWNAHSHRLAATKL